MPRLSELMNQRLESRKRQIEQNLQDMGALIDRTQKQILSTPYPPASRPGSPPHRRSGRLERESGVKVNVSTGTIELINTAPYAKFLRDGTRRMRPRPYQSLVLETAKGGLLAIERRGMPFGESE